MLGLEEDRPFQRNFAMLLFASPTSLSHQAFSLSYGTVQRRKLCICQRPTSTAFSSSSSSFFSRRVIRESYILKFPRNSTQQALTALLGGGGFLGVGPGELAVVAAVGWFLLGPEKLYAVSKDLGKLIGDLRRTANDARDSFKEALENEITANLDPPKADSPQTQSKSTDNAISSGASNEGGDYSTDLKDKKSITDDADVSPSQVSPEVVAATPASQDESETAIAENSAFLDQLKRVSDPQQAPPVSALPDLSMDDSDDLDIEDDELELQRLKIQYLEARARLNARRKVVSENNSNSRRNGANNGSNGASTDRERQSADKNLPSAEHPDGDS